MKHHFQSVTAGVLNLGELNSGLVFIFTILKIEINLHIPYIQSDIIIIRT